MQPACWIDVVICSNLRPDETDIANISTQMARSKANTLIQPPSTVKEKDRACISFKETPLVCDLTAMTDFLIIMQK